MKGADVFLGLSVKGAVTPDMVRNMADRPIIFAMANPDPEIAPEAVREIRADAIIATGRSDYPNQVNNVLGFPYIFRGALDVRARAINDEMKIAAAKALADLARQDVPDEVAAAYAGRRLKYGPDYIIPAPFDPRLIAAVPSAVAKAAMDTGVARRPIGDMEEYRRQLSTRLDPTAASLQRIFERVRQNPRRVIFAEGEEENIIRAAVAFHQAGYGTPVLIGRKDRILETMASVGISNFSGLEIHNAALSTENKRYIDFLYARLQRQGSLYRDCQRMVHQDRNVFAACMVALGDADAMITGVTRSSFVAFGEITRVIDPEPGKLVCGLTILIARGRTVFVADTLVHEVPTPEELSGIAIQAAAKARQLGHEPRVAMLSFSNFGDPLREKGKRIREAVAHLDARKVDFEYDGELSPDVALNEELRSVYPFCRLSGPANVLVMPALDPANISSKLLHELGAGTTVGPLLIGLSRPVQILPMGSTVTEIVNMAALASYDALP
jgi:malate dehydrogenase (oxaloacetate-decarboxylating)(NADP+)